MPQLVSTPVKVTELKVDDAIDVGSAGATTTVQSVEVKTKYVYVADGIGQVHRFDKDDVVVRHRMEKTDEEKAAELHAYKVDSINRAIENIHQDLEDAKSKLIAVLDFRADSHWGRYAEFVATQTVAGLWAAVAEARDRGYVGGVVAAVEEQVRIVTREIMEYTLFANRSTANMANAIEDVQRDAKVTWVRQARDYYGIGR